ncbi:MAG: 4-alpha-glucanotransferase [Dehalococcoidia bacterium]|nr:4-alpha-glucanotransferase [Dehalococcoidia bacterium]
MEGTLADPLDELAGLYGIDTAYHDVECRLHRASEQALLAVLRAMGAPVNGPLDAAAAIRERRMALWERPLAPVCVSWDGYPPSLQVRLPASSDGGSLHGSLVLENGEQRTLNWRIADLTVVASDEIEGTRYLAKQLPLPAPLPLGYHRLILDSSPAAGGPVESLVLAAPRKGYLPCEGSEARMWGAFLPLYSLYTRRSWGAGDFSDLEAMSEWIAGLGGKVVATLPLLAAFLDEPFEPSPYAPASRLFWNEMYLDATRAPELANCPQAQALLASPGFQTEIETLRKSPHVDYRRQMALKRQVLEALARCCYSGASGRLADLHRFLREHPQMEDYAGFRAACEEQHAPWPAWPSPLREGVLREGDYDDEAKRYHAYVQWLAHEQLQAISLKAREKGTKLYFDLALGAHPDSYDVWRERDSFALGVSAGAPPDPFFSEGQDWGFPPLHPERIREQGYRYYIACLRHQMKYAGVLRIDHVMGFHRLFWVPRGLKATDGVYVRYRPEEFYAILTLESSRNKVMMVGEDLGTVPAEVRPAMAEHGLHRTYVVQFALSADHAHAIAPISEDMAAAVDTHDLPSFAAFWQGQDIQERVAMGLLGEVAAAKEREGREAVKRALIEFLQRRPPAIGPPDDIQGVLGGLLSFLGASSAHIVLVNLEDLWLETGRQNMPGTHGDKYLNWRRKARYPFETFSQMLPVVDILRRVNFQRKRDSA